jgi:copper chaperone CopZ
MPTYICRKELGMEQVILKTNLSCNHCAMKVEPILKSIRGIVDYSINLEHPDKLVTIWSADANIQTVIAGLVLLI